GVDLSNANTVGMSVGAINAGVVFTGTITPASTPTTLSGTFTANNSYVIPANVYRLGGGGTLTLPNANQLTGANSVELTNGGTVVVSGTNDYSGTTAIGGTYINPSQELYRAQNTTSLITTPYTLRVN